MDARAPRAEELALPALLPAADLRQQPAEQGAVDLLVGRLRRVLAKTHLVQLGTQLQVDVVPLDHPVGREELRLAELAELAPREVALVFLEEGPELEQAEEVRPLVAVLRVGLVGELLAVDGALARILHRERRREH